MLTHSSSLSNWNSFLRRNDDVSNALGVDKFARDSLSSVVSKLFIFFWDFRAEQELQKGNN